MSKIFLTVANTPLAVHSKSSHRITRVSPRLPSASKARLESHPCQADSWTNTKRGPILIETTRSQQGCQSGTIVFLDVYNDYLLTY